MSIDKSLRRKNQLARSRNVLTRGERIKVLQSDERFPEGRSPYNLPKVRVMKVVIKKAKKEKSTAEKPAAKKTPKQADAGANSPETPLPKANPRKTSARKPAWDCPAARARSARC